MKIPASLKEKMYLVAAVGVLCQLDVQAKPGEPNTSAPAPNSVTSKPEPKNTAPSVSKDERRRALRERFEKMRRNPRLKREAVRQTQK